MKAIVSTEAGGTGLIAVEGSFVDAGGVESVREAVSRLIEEHCSRLIINLADTTFLTSLAVGELVRTHVTYSRRGWKLIVCGLNERVYTVLTVTKLNRVLHLAQTLDEARAMFRSSDGMKHPV